MAGPMTHTDYISDDGNTYIVSMPAWVATLQGAGAATATANLPKGVRARRRYLRVTATGREHPVVVADPAATLYTEGFGTAHTIPTLGSATATAVTSQGRTGERDRAI